jgi:hexosaminidase
MFASTSSIRAGSGRAPTCRQGRELTARIGQIPFNFQVGKDRDKIALHPPATPDGELEVRLDGCTGERIAALAAGRSPRAIRAWATITGRLPAREGVRPVPDLHVARASIPSG